jgi:hypothetical protein
MSDNDKEIGELTANVNNLLDIAKSHEKRILVVEKIQYLIVGGLIILEFASRFMV